MKVDLKKVSCKHMNAAIKVILATGVAIALSSSIAWGQSNSSSNEVEGDFTLKGDSLRTVENRTTSQDYRRFQQISSGNDSPSFSRSRNQVGILQIDERTDVILEDDTDWGTSFGIFQPSGDIVDSRSVQIRLKLD